MRSPAPILAISLGLAAVAVLWWSARHPQTGGEIVPFSPDTSSESAGSPETGNEAVTLGTPDGDPFGRLVSTPVVSLERKAVTALFEASPGDVVSLPLPAPIRAVVNLRYRHATGDLALGLDLDAFEEATAFLSMSPNGRIRGQVTSARSGTAYRIESDPDTGALAIRRVAADDLVCVRLDGGLLKPGLPPDPESAEIADGIPAASEESVPLLNSRPGSDHVIFLNFGGETVIGTPWNSSYNDGDPIVAAPFGTPAHIPGIWASIAEDYAVFDVDVTTDRTAFENAAPANRVMIIFTPTKAWYGSAGGVAYVDSFGSATNPYAWVFNLTLNGSAESGAHEIGHTLGLRHDGTSSRAYYTGHTHPSGVSWGPVMGTAYNRTIVQFSKGEYPNANRSENDYTLIAEHVPPLPDDHGDSSGTASVPIPSPPGQIGGTGIIGDANDRDLFRIETGGAGTIEVTATPHATYRNLDLGLELLDENLAPVLGSAPEGPFDATLTATAMPAGIYFIRIRGTGLGDLATGYGTYGSVGTYTLDATFPPSPLPDTPTDLTASDGSSTAFVTLAWDASALADGYRLYRGIEPDGSDAVLLASPSGTSHDDTTAVPGATYHYFVSAHNVAGESPRSAGESGWRQLLPPDSPATPDASDDSPHSIRVTWGAAARAHRYRVSRNAVNSFAGSILLGTTPTLSWHDTTTAPNATFFYFVEATNSGGTSAPVATDTPGLRIPLPPGTPSGLSASDGTATTHTLVSWTGDPGATGYRLYRNSIEATTGADEIAVVNGTTSHSDADGIPGVVYWYFVRSILVGGDSGPSNLETGFRLAVPPSAPASVTATRGTRSAGVLVSWLTVADATRYLVYRGAETSPDGAELIGDTTGLEWLDETTAAGRTYRYFVRAENATGLSAHSVAALGFDVTADPSDDGYENNDDLADATPLVPGEIAAVAVDGDPDWYAVALGPGETRLDIAVPYAVAQGSVLLALHDEAGLPVSASSNGVSSRVLSHTGAAGAGYRILVERDDGAAVPYRLLWSSLGAGEHGLVPDVTIGPVLPTRIGESIRNSNGAGQILRLLQRGPGSLRAFAGVTNRSAVPGTFRTSGAAGNRHIGIDYFRVEGATWRRITGAMLGKGAVSWLEPFEKEHVAVSIRVERTAGRRRRSAIAFPISGWVASDRRALDTVHLRLVRVAEKRR